MSKLNENISKLYTILGIETEEKRQRFANLENLANLDHTIKQDFLKFSNPEHAETAKNTEIIKDAKLG